MKKFILYSFLLVIVVVAGCGGQRIRSAEEVDTTPIYMGHHVPFKHGISIRQAVRKECRLEKKLASFIHHNADAYHLNLVQGDNHDKTHSSGRILDIEIIAVRGAGGGAWSGNKMVAIEGSLRDHGKVIANFVASRSSGGGAFGAYKGTCAILGRTIKALGRDVASWLQHPVMGASLGEGWEGGHHD